MLRISDVRECGSFGFRTVRMKLKEGNLKNGGVACWIIYARINERTVGVWRVR